MLLKVSLIIAILAGIGTLVVSHLQVSEAVAILKQTLQDTTADLERTRLAEAAAKKDAKASKDEAEKTARELAETQANLETATTQWKAQETRANDNEAKLNRATSQLNDAQRDLGAWSALGIPVELVRNRLGDLVRVTQARDALQEENKEMLQKINKIQAELAKYTQDKDVPPPLPAGLKGTVVAVNPQWEFVVLDIGGNQGVLERGEMLVSRDGKLVAKVRITSVEASRSIANVLPEWKQTDVQTGDIVIVTN
ncbi:MAG TPA: hypothetical protein PKM73_08060 [Verrucomicrobiota bacterium]|nr:hypothetical protein [Verrucomicrobiota bacterium]HNU51677.1 hypothetical protein [Verrucomicrobiota bacterium]